MAGRGAAKGERRGGRSKGTPNRATVEAQERLRLAAQDAGLPLPKGQPTVKKLGKEVLEDFMLVFAGMAASYQPAPAGQPPRPNQDEEKFMRYAELAVDCADRLADFQSPKFRAIAVAPPPPEMARPVEGMRVIELAKVDPQRAADSYRRFIAAAVEKKG